MYDDGDKYELQMARADVQKLTVVVPISSHVESSFQSYTSSVVQRRRTSEGRRRVQDVDDELGLIAFSVQKRRPVVRVYCE